MFIARLHIINGAEQKMYVTYVRAYGIMVLMLPKSRSKGFIKKKLALASGVLIPRDRKNP